MSSQLSEILNRVANGMTTEADALILAKALDTSRKMDFWAWVLAGFGTLIVLIAVVAK